MKYLVILAMCVAAAGCGRQAEVAAPAPAPTPDRDLPEGVLLSVDGQEYSRADLDLDMNLRLGSTRLPDDPEQRAAMMDQMARSVTGQFVVRTLLVQEAKRLGLAVSAEEEADALAEIAANLPEGHTLESVMSESMLGEEKMREEVRIGILVNKLIENQLGDRLAVGEDELAAFIEAHREQLRRSDEVRARHILLAADANASEEAHAAAQAEAEALRERLLAGEDFAELAADASVCPSKERGGDLGFFGRGRMTPAFEQAAFAQEVGAIGPVVKTPFGYHLVQVTERRDGGPLSIEDIRQIAVERKRQDIIREYIDELRAKADIKGL